MKYAPGEFVRAVHPESKRMVSAFIIGSRGHILEYHVSDGMSEWWTYMVRAQAKEQPVMPPKDRPSFRLRAD